MPDKKNAVWTTLNLQLSPGAAVVASDISDTFTAKVDRELSPGDTVSHIWVKGVWTQSAAGDSSKELLAFGIGFYPRATDAIDFPAVIDHTGDWVLHDARGFIEPLTLQTPMVPQQLATIDIESRGQRSVPRGGAAYSLFAVAASRNGVPSAGAFELVAAVTILWLVP